MTLTVGSLFSGIGGLDLGLERAGFRVKWQVELDDYCQRVLSKHWPDVPKFRDVRDCGRHNLAPVELIAGGFPCQDISEAGRRAGIEHGERSGLWREFHRVICELRPGYVLVENVSALLEWELGRVLGDLAESGYDAEWDCVPAWAVGAPHVRERVFVVAYPAGVGRDTRSIFDRAALQAQRQAARKGQWRGRLVECRRGRLRLIPDWRMDRVVDGVPPRLDRLRGLGNAVVPQVAQFIGERIMEVEQAVTA